jgi:hypothetical protein
MRVSIAALSSSQLSPETARHYISFKIATALPPYFSPHLVFTACAASPQMSFFSRSILSALRASYLTEPATVNGPTWEARAHYIRSSTTIDRAGVRRQKSGGKAHRAARSEDIPSRLSLPVAVSDH